MGKSFEGYGTRMERRIFNNQPLSHWMDNSRGCVSFSCSDVPYPTSCVTHNDHPNHLPRGDLVDSGNLLHVAAKAI